MNFSMDELMNEIIMARNEFGKKDRMAEEAIGCQDEDTRLHEAADAARHLMELKRRLREYIGLLAPGRPREVLTRHYLQFQTWDTIARALGCTVDEVEEIMNAGFREIEAAYRAGRIAEP